MKNKIIIIGALALTLSCGSVKKNKSTVETKSEINASKEQTTTQTTTNTENVKESQEGTKNTLINYAVNEYEFEPFDNSKPFFINGAKYENVKVKNKEDKTSVKVDESWKSSFELLSKRFDSLEIVNKELRNEINESKSSNKKKETDNVKVYLIGFGFLFLVVFLYWLYKKVNPLS